MVDILLKECFESVFDLTGYQCEELYMNSFEQWDSVNHMILIDRVERTFDIVVDFDSIMELKSYEEMIEYIRRNNNH